MLSAALKYDFNDPSHPDVSPLADLFSGKGFTSNVNGVRIRTISQNAEHVSRNRSFLRCSNPCVLGAPEQALSDNSKSKLLRIDGNHRLSAASATKSETIRYSTPFCIVIHEDPDSARQFEEVVFYNINAKQVPLSAEETADDPVYRR